MGKEEIICSSIARSPNPLSQGIKFGGFVFLSGQLGRNPSTGALETGMYDQTHRALENLKILLESQGFGMRDVLKTTIYVTDMALTSEMNRAYKEFFSSPFPARSCVQVAALATGAEVEIEIIAAK